MNDLRKVKSGIVKEQADLNKYATFIQGISSFANFPKLEENPFSCLLGDIVTMGWKHKGAVNGIGTVEYTDVDTGEVLKASANKIFQRKEIVDTDKFLKIYNSQLKEMFSLSYSALKVFGYFLREMQHTKESTEIYFDIKECMEFCDYNGHAMVYRGLSELIKKLFICRTSRHPIYFINPLYAFNGNRITILKQYERNDYFEGENAKAIENE